MFEQPALLIQHHNISLRDLLECFTRLAHTWSFCGSNMGGLRKACKLTLLQYSEKGVDQSSEQN